MLRAMIDLAIVGAGPIGLEAAILAKRAGLDYLVLEKGAIVNAIFHYPTYMTFFTTSERLEIGGHPLVSAADKPTRKEALDYYRKVAHNEQLALRLYTEVTAIAPQREGFALTLKDHHGRSETLHARTVIVATGYFDTPKLLGVPGEDLPHVSHYYREAHGCYGRRVTIVGGGSSAADAALDLYRAGAKVTILHRGSDFRPSLKYWIRPNLENRIKEGAIRAHFNTVVTEITPHEVIARQGEHALHVPSDVVYLLTGYYADPSLLRGAGVRIRPDDLTAELNPETFESNVPGLYVVGSAGFGTRTSDIFIENGLVHARQAVAALAARLRQGAPPVTLSRACA